MPHETQPTSARRNWPLAAAGREKGFRRPSFLSLPEETVDKLLNLPARACALVPQRSQVSTNSSEELAARSAEMGAQKKTFLRWWDRLSTSEAGLSSSLPRPLRRKNHRLEWLRHCATEKGRTRTLLSKGLRWLRVAQASSRWCACGLGYRRRTPGEVGARFAPASRVTGERCRGPCQDVSRSQNLAVRQCVYPT